jgi:acetylornithine deacetylase/succinyl-diaminopimelate desuccinylase-like protein
MKAIAVMHAAALATVASADAVPKREVILMSFADEEAGGHEGAEAVLADIPERAGFGDGRPAPEALGEGAFGLSGLLDRPLMPVVVAEKAVLWLDLIATGDPGHGALPPETQAIANLARAVTKVAGHAAPRVHPVMRQQFEILAANSSGAQAAAFRALASGVGSQVGRVLQKPLRRRGPIAALLSDTITPTQIEGGYKHNVVPGEAKASLDCRLLPDTDIGRLVAKMSRDLRKLGVSVREVSRHGGPVSAHTPLFDAIANASRSMDEAPVVVPSLTSGMTDLRFFRARGATAYGWVPLVLDEQSLATIHGHDERIEVTAFERAVDLMTQVVRAVSL